MQLWVIIMIILEMVMNPGGVSNVFTLKRSVDDHSFEEVTITGCSAVYGSGDEWLYYTGEITGDAAQRLYEIVCEQTRQPELTGGNYISGMPYLIIKAPHGQVYTCSYTWDREEYSIGEFGEPIIGPVGDCFVVKDANSADTKYQVIDADTRNEFCRLISDYLEKNCEPSEIFYEKSSTSNIVFVNRYTNYAWGKVDNGSYIDSKGDLYDFDFSDRSFQNDKEFYEALREVYENSDPVSWGIADSGKMWDVLEKEIPKIDRNAEVTKRSKSYDMGQETLYAVSLDGEMIMLRSAGDWEKHLDDAAAKRICGIYDRIGIRQFIFS